MKRINAKKVFSGIVIFLLLFVLIGQTRSAEARVKAYYSGDAAIYRGSLIIGSTNMGRFQVFTLDDGSLIEGMSLRPDATDFSQFYDLKFSEESGRLFVYLTSGKYIYKYDVSNPDRPELIKKTADNSRYGWVSSFDKTSDKVVTIGVKQTKVWNSDLEIVDQYNITNADNPYNVRFSASGDFILNYTKDGIQIFDSGIREFTDEMPMDVKESLNRKIFADDYIYAVDDQSLKKFDYNGKLAGSFGHTSLVGYDAAGIPGKKFVYFSDGQGIVKLNKKNLSPVEWTDVTQLDIPYGWSMGLKVLEHSGEDLIVSFNNSYIGVFDGDLNLTAAHRSAEEIFDSVEKIYLGVDKTRAAANSEISLHGGGFGQYEKILISLAGSEWNTFADEQGRFQAILKVPSVKFKPQSRPLAADIEVIGEYTGLSYNIGFTIE